MFIRVDIYVVNMFFFMIMFMYYYSVCERGSGFYWVFNDYDENLIYVLILLLEVIGI